MLFQWNRLQPGRGQRQHRQFAVCLPKPSRLKPVPLKAYGLPVGFSRERRKLSDNRQARRRFDLRQRHSRVHFLNAGHQRELLKEEALVGFDVRRHDAQQKIH
jgi:hypothetical protein